MKNNWLWDTKISVSEGKRVLKNPENKKFILIAALLFARNNDPREVFENYIDPLLFCRHWKEIKKRMRRDRWGQGRVVFWQAIYQKLLDKYRKKGVQFRKSKAVIRDETCEALGKAVRKIRIEEALSQKELAQKAGISQQLVSRIEKGKENISLITLKKISEALGRSVEINFV